MIQAVCFDLDGTLWDSAETVTASWNEVLKEQGFNRKLSVSDQHSVMGKLPADIVKKLFPEMDPEAGMKLFDDCVTRENEWLARMGGRLYPKVTETLAILHGKYKLYIVSNCNDGYVEAFLTAHKLWSYFDDYEYFGRTQKPKGQNIRLVLERNHVSSGVYVGDTDMDEAAAYEAGVPFIHAAYGFGKPKRKVPAIKQFADLPVLLTKL